MRRLLLPALLALLPALLRAQDSYTQHIQRQAPRRGRVVLHQSKAITDLVDGQGHTAVPTVKPEHVNVALTAATDSAEVGIAPSARTGQRVRANGYRIQVFSGGNSRAAKTEAGNVEQQVRSLFPELPIYTQFISPHWKCRVGDFRTYEEANEVFTRMKDTQRFREAVIVKSKINVYY